MNINLLAKDLIRINDPDDFQIPYRLYGRTDLEVMQLRYQMLRKTTHTYIVRLGLPSRDIKVI